MNEDLTQEPYQPTLDEVSLKERPKHKGLTELQRGEARFRIREMIVQGFSDSTIRKMITEQFHVSTPTAQKYIDKVYKEINEAKADASIQDRDLNLYLALERYKVALQLAMERKDIKNILIANQRICELLGVMPTKENGPLISMNVNHLPGITNQQVMTMPSSELEKLVGGSQKRLSAPQDDVIDVENIISAEEAEAMLRKD